MKRFFIIIAALCCAAAFAAEGKLAIATEGRSSYTIGYDTENKDPVYRAALKDLSDHLKAMTGSSIPLAYQAGGPRILVGIRAPGVFVE